MSITTKGGDGGRTQLLFGRSVGKDHPRVKVCGEVDELNAILGIARIHLNRESPQESESLATIQESLIGLMGEIATDTTDNDRYLEKGYPRITLSQIQSIEAKIASIERELDQRFKDWAIPGSTNSLASAHLDLARTVVRRCEREVVSLEENIDNPYIQIYLNRLADLFWLISRKIDVSSRQTTRKLSENRLGDDTHQK